MPPTFPVHRMDDPAHGLAAELTMLGQVAEGAAPASAFLWRAERPGLVLPERFTRAAAFAPTADASAADGWPVTGRQTGGGITPQGPGVVNLALAFPVGPGQSRAIDETYAVICAPLIAAFSALGLATKPGPVTGSFCDGAHNLEVDGRKIVGTAQRWRGRTALGHALILTDLDVGRALPPLIDVLKGLGLPHDIRAEAHIRLADLLAQPSEPTPIPSIDDQLTAALGTALGEAGYAPFNA